MQPTGKPVESKGPLSWDGPVLQFWVSVIDGANDNRRLAVRAKIDRAVGNGAALVVSDPQRQVVTVDERN